jgi:predicted aldo/keto reductase-like oxidoreductase
MENSKRREFLKKSVLGITGATLLQGNVRSAGSVDIRQEKKPELPLRELGRTGIRAPLISLGAGGAYDPNFIRAAYDAGIKLFFSATYYGEGNNEKMVGEGLKGLPRDSFVVGTAVPADGFDNRLGNFSAGFDPDAYIRKAEACLTRFGLDYVDFFLFPFAGKRESLMHEPLLKALAKLKAEGKTRFLGAATHNNCEDALRLAADSGIYDIVMTAYNFTTENKERMNEALAYAANAGIGILAMKTTAGGYRDKNRTQPLNIDAALKWVLQNQNISTIVSGMSSVEQMKKNLAMINDLRLTPDELKDLELAVSGPEPGLYCHQCRHCVPQCPNNLEIPAAMRSYMYAYGYRNTRLAKATLTDAGFDGSCCESCSSCSVRCTAGFDIRGKILDISRLREVPDEFLSA